MTIKPDYWDADVERVMADDAAELKRLLYESPVDGWAFSDAGKIYGTRAYCPSAGPTGPVVGNLDEFFGANNTGFYGSHEEDFGGRLTWELPWPVVIALLRARGYDVIFPQHVEPVREQTKDTASLYWCHANTQLNHAFIRYDLDRTLRGEAALCGVLHPGEIKTYGCLHRCPDCNGRLGLDDAGAEAQPEPRQLPQHDPCVAEVLDYLRSEHGAIDADTQLGSVLDSTAVMELVVWIENRYEFDVEIDDITPDNFGSAQKLASYICNHAGPR